MPRTTSSDTPAAPEVASGVLARVGVGGDLREWDSVSGGDGDAGVYGESRVCRVARVFKVNGVRVLGGRQAVPSVAIDVHAEEAMFGSAASEAVGFFAGDDESAGPVAGDGVAVFREDDE